MDAGTIAQMGTGEGKTLTALMPLYLNSLAGKGSHLVTVNDYLAQAGFNELKPALEKLGVSAGLVLKDMPADQKRAGYNADVTYLSNDTLGFDYLGDRTVTNPSDRVQREPYFALLDEADQVLLDEARVPLIIAGLQGDDEVKPAIEQGQLFNNIVKDLVPGEDFRIDRKMHSAFLTDVGQDIVANEVGLLELKKDDPDYKAKLAAGKELRTLLREEAKITQGETELPRELVTQRGLKAAWCHLLGRPTETNESKQLEELRARKEELLDIFPGANLYAEDQMERVRYLQNALEARGLFRLGKDYAVSLPEKFQNELGPVLTHLSMEISDNNLAKLLLAKEILAAPVNGESYAERLGRQLGVVAVAVDPAAELTSQLINAARGKAEDVTGYLDGLVAKAAQQKGISSSALLEEVLDRHSEVQIIDEFKGRISEGRRFTQGLHQALEIKEGLEPKPETYTVASITYPNLFRRYQRVAGMTGTAESSKKEFSEVLGLNVVNVPPNKERKRVDHPDKIFATQEDKFKAVTEEVRNLFQEGIPVLVATRSVEMNQYVSALLSSEGIPNQALDAQDVKTNTPEENAIISTAGQSGVITVATNMAGRGVDIKPDAVNYKKLAVACDTACREGKSVVVQLDPNQPDQVDRLTAWFNLPEDDADKIKYSQGGKPEKGKVLLTFEPVTGGDTVLKAEDFPGKKLVVLATERNLDQRIDDQLRGRAGRQGAPGETQFYVSLEDDLMRIYGDEDREKLKKLLDKPGGEDKIRKLSDEAQERVQNMNADARLQTAKFDQVANKQREVVWGFRDSWVDSRPGRPQTDKTMDIGATVHDWVVDAYTLAVGEAMKEQKGNSEARLQGAVAQVAKDFKFPVDLPEGKGDWKKRLDSALRTQLGKVEESINTNRPSDLHTDFLETYQWQTALQNLDKGWTNQLQVLEDEKQGSNLEAYAGREPEQAYIERAFKAFDEMWNYVKGETTRTLLQQMTEVDDLLKARKA
jgi:preprotein translocase subunit SecA